jgi:hypothetical protein
MHGLAQRGAHPAEFLAHVEDIAETRTCVEKYDRRGGTESSKPSGVPP